MKLPSLYLIADPRIYKKEDASDLDSFFEGLREAIAGGLRLVQYRDKCHSRSKRFEIAKQVRKITHEGGARLIVNDEIDLAMAIKADGVHLGQNDFPVSMARKLLGESALIGLSTHNLSEVHDAAGEAIDYIGFGPIFATTTKQAHEPTVGTSGIRTLREQTSLPIYAIGGIQLSHLHPIIAAGASGVAVAAALKGADRSTVWKWKNTLEQALKKNNAHY